MNVLAVQLDIEWENKKANFERVRSLLDEAQVDAGSLIVLPEMFATGFSMNVANIAEAPGGETETFLAEIAGKHQSCVIGGVVTKAPDGRGRNEAVAFSTSGDTVVRYCKLYPFTYSGEDKHYEPGADVLSFPCGEFITAPFICYDLRFPEAFRAAVRLGATLFVVIANWPQAREAHWSALLRARAIENQAYVVGVNRCGNDPKTSYSGQSVIFDPKGEVLAEANSSEEVIQATVELTPLTEYRRRFPALDDMRDGKEFR